MISNNRVQACFQYLVGWRESARAGSCYDALEDGLKRSDSGVYFNDLPGVTLEMVNEMVGKDNASVNDYLENVSSSTINEMCNKFIIAQKNSNYTKALLSNYAMGVYAQNMRIVGLKNNRFVGFEIRPKLSNSIKAQIIEFWAAFDSIQTNLPIYLYASTQIDPIATWTITTTKTNSFERIDLNGDESSSTGSTSWEEVMSYIDRTRGHGARYFIGYYEEDLTGSAIDTRWPGFGGCTSCGGGQQAKDHLQYIVVQPCEVGASNTYTDRKLFDIDNVGYSDSTYGLMLKINAVCDVSEALCDNKIMFANVYQKMVGIRILWDAVNTNRLNSTNANQKENWRNLALKYEFEVFGGTVEGRYQKGELEVLTVDFSNIDPQCIGARKASFGVMNL
jgi:hypothetical protein